MADARRASGPGGRPSPSLGGRAALRQQLPPAPSKWQVVSRRKKWCRAVRRLSPSAPRQPVRRILWANASTVFLKDMWRWTVPTRRGVSAVIGKGIRLTAASALGRRTRVVLLRAPLS
jgi:hypothetical protein